MKLVRSFLGVLFSLLALLLTGCGGGGGGGDDDTSAIPNGNGTEVWAFKDSQYSSNIATLTLNKSGTAPATATVELSYYDSDYGVRISGTVTGKATVTSSTIYLDTSGNLKANSGESGQCRVIFDGKLENGYASGHGSVNCPSTGAGAYSTSGSWNGMRSSGSGVTSPTITSTVAARSNANPNLPTSADTTLGSFNSYMPLTVGSTLKYSVTAGSVTADVTTKVTQGGSSPVVNISANANILSIGTLTMQGQTQNYSILGNALYMSSFSGSGTFQGVSFTATLTQTPPYIFFPSSPISGTTVNISNSSKITVTAQGQSKSETYAGSGTFKVTSTTDTVSTPAGTFTKALKTELTSAGSIQETRWFVAGIGQVKYQTSQGTGVLTSYNIYQ